MTDSQELLSSYGSPLFRYDLAEVRAAVSELRRALPAYARLFYSLKANPHPDIVAATRKAGCAAEVSSSGELSRAVEAGHQPATILYTGPGKSAAEVRRAIERGVRVFSTESLRDLGEVLTQAQEVGAEVECLVRVNASTAQASTGIRMTGTPSQFGFDLDGVARWAGRALDLAGPALAGLHFFPISNARAAEHIVAEVEASLEVAALLREEYDLPVRWLDLGGGFAAPFARPGARPAYGDLRDRIDAAIRRSFPLVDGGEPRVAFESGRYLVSTAGSLLTTVVDVKGSKGRRFVVMDAGINHLGGMSGLRRLLPLAARPLTADENGAPATLVGPLCTPNDVLAHDVAIGAVEAGDHLVVPNVGAYGLSASLVAFLSREPPVEVVVDGDREVSASRLRLERTPVLPSGRVA